MTIPGAHHDQVRFSERRGRQALLRVDWRHRAYEKKCKRPTHRYESSSSQRRQSPPLCECFHPRCGTRIHLANADLFSPQLNQKVLNLSTYLGASIGKSRVGNGTRTAPKLVRREESAVLLVCAIHCAFNCDGPGRLPILTEQSSNGHQVLSQHHCRWIVAPALQAAN